MSPKTEAAPQGETTRKHRGENVRLISLALAVLSFLMILALSYTRFYHQVELKTLDLRFRLRPPISVSAKIVMIDLDDESVLKFGRWPWPRTMMAELVDQITRYGVDNIFFDIEFIDPSGETLTAEHTKQDIQKKFDKLKGTLFTLIEKDLKHVEAGGSADELLDKLFQSGGEITREIRELETVLTSGLHDPDLALEQSFIRNGHIVCVFHFDTYIEERVNTGNILEEAILAQLRKNLDLTASDIAADLNLSIKDVELLLPRTRNRVVAETVREIVSSAGETFEIDLLADRVVEALPSKEAEGCRYRAEQFITRDLARKILLERFSLPLSRAKDYLPHFRIAGLVPIIPGLAQAVRGAGFANANPDIDGTFRRLPLFLNEGDRLLPQGAFMLSLDLLGAELKDIRFDERGTLIISPAGGKVLELPLDRNNMFLVNWAGGWQKPFKHLSVSELMTDREMEKVHWRLLKSAFELLRRREADHMDDLPGSEETITKAHETIVPELVDFATRLNRMVNTSDRLKNKPAMLEEALARVARMERLLGNLKIVKAERQVLREKISAKITGRTCLVGSTASTSIDLGVTPFEEKYPMIGMHANLLNGIVTGNFIRELPAEWTYGTALIMALVLGFTLPRLGYKAGTSVVLTMVLGYILAGFYLFFLKGFIVEMISPVLTVFLAFTFISVYRYRTEESQKKYIKDAFSHYLSPDVINQLIANPENLTLGGEERVLTALFSDVAGFSTISEKLSPSELVALLNEYLTAMTDIILEHGGTVDKYEGDAIIAFFGAPVSFPDHAERASLACIRMQEKLASMRSEWKKTGEPLLTARIGLCTGPMVVGNMGSKTRMDYTIMGDSVNLASRLEGANKQYGTSIMAANTTYIETSEAIEVRLIDVIRVVGKKTPVSVYELLAAKGELDKKDTRWLAAYNEARELYAQKRWPEALAAFNRTLELRPDDALSKTYIERCNRFIKDPPPEDWDGVYTLTSK